MVLPSSPHKTKMQPFACFCCCFSDIGVLADFYLHIARSSAMCHCPMLNAHGLALSWLCPFPLRVAARRFMLPLLMRLSLVHVAAR
jgi:hypothetical protein